MDIRLAKKQDLNFITSNWLKQYRGSIFARNMSKDVYFNSHNILVNEHLRNSVNILAVDPKDSYVIWGFISFKKTNTIDYVFVKNHFRGHGIGKRLFKEAISFFDKEKPITMTHLPKHKKYPEGWEFEYNPYLFLSGVDYNETKISKGSTSSKVRRENVDKLSHGGCEAVASGA